MWHLRSRLSARCSWRVHRHRLSGVFCRPAHALIRRHRAPSLPQGTPLLGGQGLEFFERFTDLGAFFRRQVVEDACVLAQLATLCGRHRGPARQSCPDLPLTRGRQCGPVVCVGCEAVLASRAQLLPLVSYRGEHALLIGTQTRPRQRRLRGVGLRLRTLCRRLRGNRGGGLRIDAPSCANQARCDKQREEPGWTHDQLPPFGVVAVTFCCEANQR